jgi:hypothetical protein
MKRFGGSSSHGKTVRLSSLMTRSLSQNHVVPNFSGERGAGRLKAIIWTFIFLAFIFTCVKVFPVLLNQYQFQDGIQNIARFATVNRQDPEQIRKSILTEAEKDSVPISAEDIKVEAHNGNVRINVDYSVTVDLLVYRWTMNFHPAVSNNALL